MYSPAAETASLTRAAVQLAARDRSFLDTDVVGGCANSFYGEMRRRQWSSSGGRHSTAVHDTVAAAAAGASDYAVPMMTTMMPMLMQSPLPIHVASTSGAQRTALSSTPAYKKRNRLHCSQSHTRLRVVSERSKFNVHCQI